jgi:hypothetical protein
MRRRARPEDQIQRAVITHLKVRAPLHLFWFHVPMGGKRKKIEAAIFNGLGSTAGVPDLILIYEGKVYGLELKVEGGRVSEAQRCTIERMKKAGAYCEICFGIDAALRWLEARGLLLGKTA